MLIFGRIFDVKVVVWVVQSFEVGQAEIFVLLSPLNQNYFSLQREHSTYQSPQETSAQHSTLPQCFFLFGEKLGIAPHTLLSEIFVDNMLKARKMRTVFVKKNRLLLRF